MLEAVLFDLDGTLADTAPDLGAALNRVRSEEGLAPLPLGVLRPYTSQGVRGLLRAGFGIAPEDAAYPRLAERLLDFYATDLCVETRLFAGMAELLDALDAAAIAWGIVTNKRERFTAPLVDALGLGRRIGCVVSGDTTAAPKPSPLPILYACERLRCRPAHTLYVGDDRRDIEAGKAAGTRTVAVAYGYLGVDGEPGAWNADFIVNHPEELSELIFGRQIF